MFDFLKRLLRGRDIPVVQASITRERIDELVRFLPTLDTPRAGINTTFHSLDRETEGGEFIMPHPSYPYPPAVGDLFLLTSQECWCDFGYSPKRAARMIRSDAVIASASLAQIKTMLTFCVRGERYCDGHWDAMIREGRIAAILRRLSQLRDTVPDTDPAPAYTPPDDFKLS